MHARASALLALVALAALSTPTPAQDGGGVEPWRAEVDALLDRWNDRAGSDRLARARDALSRRIVAAPADGAAIVELARCELALGRADDAVTAIEEALRLFGREESAEHERLAETNADRERHGLPRLDPGAELLERRARALAVGYLAATEQALAHARTLEGDAAVAFLRERQARLSGRREALLALAGEEQGAELLRQETARRRELRTLDRLGREPRPIGQTDAAGQPIELRAYRGKALLVVFWSHELGGCEEALKEVDAAQKELGARGFEAIGVCLDAPGGPASAWLEEQGIAWRQVFTDDGLLSRDARAWGVTSIPSGVLVDHMGAIRYVDPWLGDVRLAVAELLRRKEEAAAAAERRGR